MKVLVTGARGQLGSDLLLCLQERKIPCLGADRDEFDITDIKATKNFLTEYHPDAVIHCAAYTKVDQAEQEAELCYKVNAEGTKNIAQACKVLGSKMLYLSTDYVFSGTGENFYKPLDTPSPLNIYGKTKYEGERHILAELEQYFIVRVSWIFGKNGNNFVKTMLRLGTEHKEINVVQDQIGSPTYTKDLVPLLCDMVMTQKYGIYHATNEGVCSWADFAKEIFRQAGLSVKVNPILTSKYPTKAVRPMNSRLSKECLTKEGFQRLPVWQDALKRYLEEDVIKRI